MREPVLPLVTLRVKSSILGVKCCKCLSYIYTYMKYMNIILQFSGLNFFLNLYSVLSCGGFEMVLYIDL